MHEPLRFPRPFGRYVLTRQLAVGGMAEVYLARQNGPAGFEKVCVIKRILPALQADKQFVAMFLDEARIAARLTHPNIVQIFELGQVEHDHFIAMEHVHGVDLQQVIDQMHQKSTRIPLSIALRIVSNIAEGLDHAHRATDGRGQPLGIVHRDVTPSNVVVSFDGVSKICDFGIAKAVAKGGRTEVGVIKGKVPYMSPEQVEGAPLDARSDLFSLGSVLYELTVGVKPFDGHNPAELSVKILHDEPVPPELILGEYPPPLDAILKRALAKRREDRFQSAREMQDAIEEFLVTSGIRCTSHEVAEYLDTLFPGARTATLDAGVAPAPVVPTDPTVPMFMSGGGRPEDRVGTPEPILGGDLSAPVDPGLSDARRNLGGGGGGGVKVVVFALVIAVAVAFWYLRAHMQPEAPPPQPGASAPQPTVTPPSGAATPTPPTQNTPPKTPEVQKAEPTQNTEKRLAPPGEKPPAAAAPTEAAPSPAAPAEKPAAEPAAEKPAAEAPKPEKHAAPKHKPPAHKAEPPAERSLPRLPTPPPAEEESQ